MKFVKQNLTQSGQYSQTFQTIAGCDSIVNFTLVVNPIQTINQNTTICQGETVNFFGQTLNHLECLAIAYKLVTVVI